MPWRESAALAAPFKVTGHAVISRYLTQIAPERACPRLLAVLLLRAQLLWLTDAPRAQRSKLRVRHRHSQP